MYSTISIDVEVLERLLQVCVIKRMIRLHHVEMSYPVLYAKVTIIIAVKCHAEEISEWFHIETLTKTYEQIEKQYFHKIPQNIVEVSVQKLEERRGL